MKGFSVVYRNYGHWDFYSAEGRVSLRVFRLRGSGAEWFAMDEREAPYPVAKFKTFSSTILFITESLMHESLKPDPESPGNNVLQQEESK